MMKPNCSWYWQAKEKGTMGTYSG